MSSASLGWTLNPKLLLFFFQTGLKGFIKCSHSDVHMKRNGTPPKISSHTTASSMKVKSYGVNLGRHCKLAQAINAVGFGTGVHFP